MNSMTSCWVGGAHERLGGMLMEAVVRRPLPYNGRVASRLLDSACYRSLRAGRELGFRPRYRLEDALPEMVEVYRRQADR